VQQSLSAVAEGIRDFNIRLMEMAQLNTVAALDFAREMSTAKGPADAAARWSSHAQKQFDTLTEQSKELTALGPGAENCNVKRRAYNAQLWACSQRDYLRRPEPARLRQVSCFSADQYRRQPLNELKSPLIGAGDAGPSLLRRDIDSDAGTNLRLPLDPHRSETV
jgi:erythromycin esterase-like protein